MSLELFALAKIDSQRAMNELVEGAGPGSARAAAHADRSQPGLGRLALLRRFAGRTLIRAGERLRGATALPDAAYSA